MVRGYKFYGSQYALSAIQNQRLKVSTLEDLNDPFEFQSFRLSNKTLRNAWWKVRDDCFSTLGLICFSKSWSNPVIWSHYGEKHFGAALGFDVRKHLIAEVRYKEKRPDFPMPSTLPASKMLETTQGALATKYKHWEYENEFRLFVDKASCDEENGIYFKNFDNELVLREIIIGARSLLTTADFRDAGLPSDVQVTTTRLAFNEYKVVKQRHPNLQR